MNILIHSEPWGRQPERLEERIRAQLPETGIVESRDIKSLTSLLRRPLSGISIVVLYVGSLDKMAALLSLKSLFDGKKRILMLKKEFRDGVRIGLELNPSFIGNSDQGTRDLLLVLERIAGRSDQIQKRHYA